MTDVHLDIMIQAVCATLGVIWYTMANKTQRNRT
jgi:hypothetical protein